MLMAKKYIHTYIHTYRWKVNVCNKLAFNLKELLPTKMVVQQL